MEWRKDGGVLKLLKILRRFFNLEDDIFDILFKLIVIMTILSIFTSYIFNKFYPNDFFVALLIISFSLLFIEFFPLWFYFTEGNPCPKCYSETVYFDDGYRQCKECKYVYINEI